LIATCFSAASASPRVSCYQEIRGLLADLGVLAKKLENAPQFAELSRVFPRKCRFQGRISTSLRLDFGRLETSA
jgi:hypothetical protein